MDSDMLFFASSIYILVACLFLAETYLEGAREDDGWDVWRVLGLAAACVWPLYVLAVFGLLAISDRPRRSSLRAAR